MMVNSPNCCANDSDKPNAMSIIQDLYNICDKAQANQRLAPVQRKETSKTNPHPYTGTTTAAANPEIDPRRSGPTA